MRLSFHLDFDGPGLVLENQVAKGDFEHGDYFDLDEIVDAISQGVMEGLREASPDNEPIQALKVAVADITVHPVDTQPYHFVEAAKRAVHLAVDEVGLVYMRPS